MTTDRPFRVNTKKARSAAAKAECAEELGALFSCMMVREAGRKRRRRLESFFFFFAGRQNVFDQSPLRPQPLFNSPFFLLSSSVFLSKFAS